MKEQKEHKIKNSNFIDACNNAVNGIIYATTTQRNIKKQLIIAVLVLVISLFFNLSKAEFICLVFSIVLVIIMEMVNTAVETVVDLYTDMYHPKAKIAKDVAAGGVVIASLNAVIVGYFLFFDKISEIGTTVLESAINSPIHLAFVTIIITIIAVVSIRAIGYTDKRKFINKRFIPSGQTAIAFSALTAIWLTTSNVIVFTLSLLLSILIAENRIESKTKKLSEVIFGACMGVLIAVLIYALTMLK